MAILTFTGILKKTFVLRGEMIGLTQKDATNIGGMLLCTSANTNDGKVYEMFMS